MNKNSFIKSCLIIFITVFSITTSANTETELIGHNYEVHSVSYSNDGKLLASGSGDTTAIVWDTQTKKEIFTITDHSRTIYSVAFSKVEKDLLATSSSDGHLILWNVATKKLIKTLVEGDTTSNGIMSLDFSPISNLLAVAYMGGELAIYNTKTFALERVTKAHPYGFAMSVKFSDDGRVLVTTGGIDNSVRLFKSDDLTLLQIFGDQSIFKNQKDEYRGTIWDAAFSPDGKTIATVSTTGVLSFWKKDQIRAYKEIQIHDYLALSIEYSLDGSKIYVGVDAFNSEEGNFIKVINAKTGKIEKEIEAHKNRIRGMALSPDGTHLATASWDETVKIWDL